MGTESENEGGPGFEESTSEPIGLSATAHGKPAHRRSLPHIAPQHQQAVHLSVAARRHAREGREEEARRLFRQAADLERIALKSIHTQPDRSLIAEFGARVALQCGDFDLANTLARMGNQPPATEVMGEALLRISIQADLLLRLEEFERDWRVPWESDDEESSRICIWSPRAGRRLTFIMDEEASSAREIGDVNPITFIIPVCRPNEETLSVIEDSLSRRWRRRPQA